VTLSEEELDLLGAKENVGIKRYIDDYRHNISVELLLLLVFMHFGIE